MDLNNSFGLMTSESQKEISEELFGVALNNRSVNFNKNRVIGRAI